MNHASSSIGSSAGSSSFVNTDMHENDGSVQYIMSMTAQQSQDCRPTTTKRAYYAKANEFLRWAAKTFVHESELERGIVSGEKLKTRNISVDYSFQNLQLTCYYPRF
jgi:hypothetical protein